MKRSKRNYTAEEYYDLFKQGYNYKQVASKLNVHASSAVRQWTKWQALQKEAMTKYLPSHSQSEELTQPIACKNYKQEQLEQDVLDYEAMRIHSLCNLYAKLNQAITLENSKAVKEYTAAIHKLNEPLSTLANIRGIKS